MDSEITIKTPYIIRKAKKKKIPKINYCIFIFFLLIWFFIAALIIGTVDYNLGYIEIGKTGLILSTTYLIDSIIVVITSGLIIWLGYYLFNPNGGGKLNIFDIIKGIFRF